MENVNLCENCIYGTLLVNKTDVLCTKRGIVKCDFVCKKHKFDLTTKQVRRRRNIKL